MITVKDIRTFLPNAAPAAWAFPCQHSSDTERRSGYVLALAGRYAR